MKDYFNHLEQMLAAQGKLAAFSGHNPDIGTNREDALIDILNNHLPQRINAISGGTIINLEGDESAQIDIIVKSDIFPNFGATTKPRVITESVAGVISVKSMLNKSALFDAIENVASVPAFTNVTLSFSQGAIQRVGLDEQYRKHWPFRMIYAYDGIDPDAIYDYAKEYYNANKERLSSFPDIIAVNKRLCIRYLPEGGKLITGEDLPPNYMNPVRLTDETQGYSIAGLITKLNDYISWMHYMKFNLSPYIDRAFGQAE